MLSFQNLHYLNFLLINDDQNSDRWENFTLSGFKTLSSSFVG